MRKAIAIDFDGCICTDAFPFIGKPTVREAFVDGIEFEAPFPASIHSYLKERPFPAGPKDKASAAFLFPLCQFNDWPVWLPDEREGIGADAPDSGKTKFLAPWSGAGGARISMGLNTTKPMLKRV